MHGTEGGKKDISWRIFSLLNVHMINGNTSFMPERDLQVFKNVQKMVQNIDRQI